MGENNEDGVKNDLLLKCGLEWMDDKKSVLIQKIKTVIIELVHYSEEPLVANLSTYLAERPDHDYTYLANLFSEVQVTTKRDVRC